MSTHAGVALSRVAGGTPFSLTLISGELNQPILSETTTHTLSGDSPEAIVESISDLTGNAAALAITLPTYVPSEQKTAFRDVNRMSFSHSMAFVELNPFEITNTDAGPLKVLFLDTTPGQAAAELSFAELDENWFVTSEEKTVLPETFAEILSTQDIMSKLVVPTVSNSTDIHQIAILHPEGEDSGLESALKTLFPSARVKWVTLTDLSRGASLRIHRMPPLAPGTEFLCSFDVVPVPVGILLANGRIATIVPRLKIPPVSKTIVLTTSHDNQTTATLQFVNGSKSCGQVVLEGITPKPKGAVRIQTLIEIDHEGNTVATVEELDSANKKVAGLISVLSCTREDIDEFLKQEESGANAQGYYDGPEMGELPV